MSSPDDPVAAARSLLTNSLVCPGCHMPLTGQVCTACGLDLSGPLADEVWRASVAAAAALDARQERIAALYRAGIAAPAGAAVPPHAPNLMPAAEPRAVHPVPRATTMPAASPGPVRLPRVPAIPSGLQAPASVPRSGPPRRHWTVQAVLQVLGAGLLAAACIVFLVVAWGSFPLAVRAAVIGLATVLVFALASELRRRSLPQGAEAVAALAVVLLLLDAWAVRRTGLISGGPAWAYSSAALLVCAGLLALWGRRSRLATGGAAAAALWLSSPLPLLAWRPGPVSVGWVALLVTAASLVRFLPDRAGAAEHSRRPAGGVLTCGAVVSGAVAAAWAVVLVLSGPSDWAAPTQLGALAAVAAMTAALARRSTGDGWDLATTSGWAAAAGVAAAMACAAAGSAAVLGRHGGGWTALGAAAGAAAVLATVAAALGASRGTAGRTVDGVLAGAGLLVGVAALGVAVLVGQVVPGATSVTGELAAVTGAVALGALAAGVAGARRRRVELARLSAGLAVTAVVAAAVATTAAGPRPWLPTLTLLALTAAFVATDLLLSRATMPSTATSPRWWRDGGRGGSIAAALVALGSAAPERSTVGVAVAGTTALALSARGWHRDAAAPTTCLAGVLGAGAVGLLTSAAGVDVADATCIAAAVGAVALATVAFVVPRAGLAERRATFGCALALAALGWAAGASSAAPLTAAAVVAAVLVLTATLWRGADRVAPAARTQAVAATAPVLALVAPTLRATTWSGLPLTAGVLVAAGLGAATALLAPWAAERAGAAARGAAEGGGAVTLAAAFAAAWLVDPELAAIVLLVAAVTALGVGLAPGRSAWRWGALVLAAAASWVLLGARDVPVAEAYLAPAGAVLAVVGARRTRHGAEGAPSLLGAGLALVLLPSAVLPGAIPLGAGLSRTWSTTAASAVLAAIALVAAAHAQDSPAGRRSWTYVVAGLAAGLAVLGPLRNGVATALGLHAESPAVPEAWALAAVVVLGAAAGVVALGPHPDPASRWPACLAAPLAAAAVPSTLAVAPGALGWTRAVGVLALTATGAVLALHALLTDPSGRRGLDGALATATGLATLVTVVAIARLHDVPGDLPLTVLGALGCVLGVQWLRARPATGTWQALGAGLGMALVVPTFVGLGGDATWRPLYLVVAGVAAVAAGAALRWQAPFVVGSGVLLVVLAAYLGPWVGTVLALGGGWPSLAVGGAVLLALGLTYERRLAQAREAARFVGAMR